MTKTYAKEISDAQVMLSGIISNQTVLSRRKIDASFAGKLQNVIETCIQLNNEQEQLKARLKEKTKQVNENLNELRNKTKEARKIIKLDIPKTGWKEFGITDKQ